MFPVGVTTNVYKVTDASGNSNTCSVDVTRYPEPIVGVRADTTVYYEQAVTLYATSKNVVKYEWTPNLYLNDGSLLSPICTPMLSTDYVLVGISADGCASVPASVYITVKEGGEILVPNTFSPNGDGYNDYFEIPGVTFLPEMELSIFNRNGEILYSKKGYQNEWGGTYNGAVLPVATYYFVINFTDGRDPITGDITIIK